MVRISQRAPCTCGLSTGSERAQHCVRKARAVDSIASPQVATSASAPEWAEASATSGPPTPGGVPTPASGDAFEGSDASEGSEGCDDGTHTDGRPRSTARQRAERVFPDVAGQRSLATSAQVREAGWTHSAMRHAVRRIWQMPFPGVYAARRGELDEATLLVGAALWAGPRAALTGLIALRELGLAVTGTCEAIFLVPERCRARRATCAGRGVRVVRTSRTLRAARRDGPVTVADAARALADAAVLQPQPAGEIEALTIAALQRGLCSPEDVATELRRRPRTGVAGVHEIHRGLDAFLGGAWSRPEAVLRQHVDAASDLPEMLSNVRLFTLDGALVGTPDGYFPSAGVVAQVHSRAHHQGTDAQGGSKWASTVEKDSDYAAAGLVGVAPWTLHQRPGVFLRRLRETIRQGTQRPLPPIDVRPRPTN